MADYISREAFMRWAREFYPDPVLISGIINAPAADAVPVVRCEKCQHSEKIDYQGRWLYCCMRYAGPSVVRKDDFCSHGEKKED